MTLRRSLYTLAALLMIAAGVALFIGLLRHDPAASSYSNSDNNKSMFLDRADVDLRVLNDGSMIVTETLAYDLGSVDWHGLYQDVILARGEQVSSVRVSRLRGGVGEPFSPGSGIKLGVGGAYGTFGYGVIKDPGRRLRIVWNINEHGPNVFRLRFRLTNAVTNYSDAAALLWDVWGTGWETGVGSLTSRVRFPSAISMFAPRAGDLQRRVRDVRVGGNRGSFEVAELPARRQVQLRAAAAPLSGIPARPSMILGELKAEQAAIDARNAKQAAQSAKLLNRPWSWFAIKSLLAALLGLLLVGLCWLWIGRDKTHPVSAGGSYQYPPEEIPPAVIARALGGSETKNLVSATLLGFLQRDVFRVLPSVEKKEDVSIRNAVGQTTFDPTKVADYELPIAELLQSAIDKHEEHSPDFTKLKKYLDAKTAETKIKSFESKVKAQFPAYELKSTYRGRVRRWLIGILALLLYALGLLFCFSDGGNAAVRYDEMKPALFFFGFAPVLLWAAIEGNVFYRLKSDQAERVRKWETYQDFFAQMDMSREYPLTVEIWDQALLYAAAFGYAKKVITNMPRTDASGTPIVSGDTTGTAWMAGNAWAASSFASISSGVSGVTGMASSSSSGGGGFSGGGSGGGGGGGW